MTIEKTLVWLALVFYILYFILGFLNTRLKIKNLVLIGLIFQIASLILRAIYSKHAPFADIYESVNFFSLCIVLAALFGGKTKGLLGMSIFIGIIFLILSLIFYKQASSLPISLRSFWYYIHVPASFLSYGFFTVAFSSAIQMLFIKPGGEEDTISNVSYINVKNAFVLLTIGIITGSLWAKSAWGNYWGWDPKETSSLVLWFVYLFYFHLSGRKISMNKKVSWVLIIGFIIVIFTFLGLNFLPIESLHKY